jgi:hypothetical protein
VLEVQQQQQLLVLLVQQLTLDLLDLPLQLLPLEQRVLLLTPVVLEHL